MALMKVWAISRRGMASVPAISPYPIQRGKLPRRSGVMAGSDLCTNAFQNTVISLHMVDTAGYTIQRPGTLTDLNL
jgi:hypothetical protein